MTANPFTSAASASRYRAGRPDWTPYAASAVRRVSGIDEPVPAALDVACGTGISSRALAGLARSVVGTDLAEEMLPRVGSDHSLIAVLRGAAERLPFRDSCFDLIGVASALHWFDLARFAAEADRVAAPDATLLVLDHWFAGEMEGQPGFAEWAAGYVERYPSPPRDRSWRPADDLGRWRHVAVESYDHSIRMGRPELITYLASQSNLQVVVDRGEQTADAVRAWLDRELAPFYGREPSRAVGFAGYVACLRR